METSGHTNQCFTSAMDFTALELLELTVARPSVETPDGSGSTLGVATTYYLESGDAPCSCND